MKSELLAKSPLLALPLFAIVLFLVVFVTVVLVTMSRKARAYEPVARLPFEAEDDDAADPHRGGARS
jgi:cbb3-type cytochrome oxidase subunit 3